MKKTRKIVALLLAMCLILSVGMVSALADYNDAEEIPAYMKEGVQEWTNNGIFQGDENGDFRATDPITRAEAATVLARLFQLTEKADISAFTDMVGHWGQEAVAKCVAAGIMNGTSETTMEPDGFIKRADFFVMLARALNFPDAESMTGSFADSDKIPAYAKGAIYALVNAGYVSGDGTNLNPGADIIRGDVACLLSKMFVYANEDGATYTAVAGKIILVVAENVTVEVPEGVEDVTIVAAEDAEITVNAAEDAAPAIELVALVEGVELAEVPAGSTVEVSSNDVTINDEEVAAGETYEVPEEKQPDTGSGSGSTTPDPYIPPYTPPATSDDPIDYDVKLTTPTGHAYDIYTLTGVKPSELTFSGATVVVKLNALTNTFNVTKSEGLINIAGSAADADNWADWSAVFEKSDGAGFDWYGMGADDVLIDGKPAMDIAGDLLDYTDEQIKDLTLDVTMDAGDWIMVNGFKLTAKVPVSIKLESNNMTRTLMSKFFKLYKAVDDGASPAEAILAVLNAASGSTVTVTFVY